MKRYCKIKIEKFMNQVTNNIEENKKLKSEEYSEQIISSFLTGIGISKSYIANIAPVQARPFLMVNEYVYNVGVDSTYSNESFENANLKQVVSAAGSIAINFIAGAKIATAFGYFSYVTAGKVLNQFDTHPKQFLNELDNINNSLTKLADNLYNIQDGVSSELANIKAEFKNNISNITAEVSAEIDSFIDDYANIISSLGSLEEGAYSYVQIPGMEKGVLLQKQGDNLAEVNYPIYEPEQYAAEFENITINSEKLSFKTDQNIFELSPEDQLSYKRNLA